MTAGSIFVTLWNSSPADEQSMTPLSKCIPAARQRLCCSFAPGKRQRAPSDDNVSSGASAPAQIGFQGLHFQNIHKVPLEMTPLILRVDVGSLQTCYKLTWGSTVCQGRKNRTVFFFNTWYAASCSFEVEIDPNEDKLSTNGFVAEAKVTNGFTPCVKRALIASSPPTHNPKHNPQQGNIALPVWNGGKQ